MKKQFPFLSGLIIILLFSGMPLAKAGTNTGIWDWYVYIAGNGYYMNNSSGYGGLQAFNGTNFGNVTSTSLFLTASQVNTWKSASGNVCGATMYYRIYMQGTTAPAYSTLSPLNYDGGYGNQVSGSSINQRWVASSPNIDLKSGITAPGSYNIDIYFAYTGDDASSGGCSGSGSPYASPTVTATFTFGNTYYWIGGATSGWNTAGAWSSSLGGASAGVITPSASNVYIFDRSNLGAGYTGAVTATNGALSAPFTVGQIVLKNNAAVTYNPSGAYHITINGGSGTDLDVPATDTLTFGEGAGYNITLATGATATIAGTVNIGTTGSKSLQLIGTDAGSIQFNSGASCYINITSTINPFGSSATNDIVVFNSGSRLYHTKSDDIFGGATGSSKRVLSFQSGSTYEFRGTSATALAFRLPSSGSPADRTFSNVVINTSSTINAGQFVYNATMDSLIIASGNGAFTIQDTAHTLTIKGNLSNYSASQLSFAPGGTGTETINFSGSGTQYILNRTGSNSGIIFGKGNAGRIVAVYVINGSTVKLGNGVDSGNITLLSISGTSSATTFTVKTGGTLDMGTSVIYGNSATTGGTFTTETGSTLKMGSTQGIAASTASGNVQTQTRNFNTGGNYEYNGATGNQITGDGLPATVNNLTINNTYSGGYVQLTNATGSQVNGALYLKAATLDMNGKTIAMGNAAGNNIYVTGARTINNTSGTEALIDMTVTGTGNLTVSSVSGTSLAIGTKVELRTAKGVDFGNNFTTLNDTFRIKSGGYVPTTGYPPFYSSSSTLIYDCGCNFTSINSATKEWYENTFGSNAGVPNHVILKSGSSLNFSNTAFPHEMRGNLIIGEATGSASTLALSTASGGDFKIGGNWTRNALGVFTHNNRTVEFNGTSAIQTITVTGGGTEAFAYMTFNNSGNYNVQLAASPNATNISSAMSSNDVLYFQSSGLDLNGNTCTLTGTGGNIKVSGAARTITGAANSVLAISGSSGFVGKTVTAVSSGSLVTDVNVKISLNCGIDFGSSLTTIKGTLSINANGYVFTNPPTYFNNSYLVYNSTGSYNRNIEWSASSGSGYPYHVTVQNGTTVDLSANGGGVRYCGGDLTLGVTGSTGNLTMNTMTVPLNVAGSVNIGGTTGTSTLTLGSISGSNTGDLYVGGNWTRNSFGAFVHNNRTVFLNSASDGVITASGGQTFNNVVLTKTNIANTISLADSINITNELRLVKGTIDLSNKNITLLSSSTKTARIDSVSTTSNVVMNYSGTGRFVVQRYIPPNRAWRLLTAPLQTSGAPTISSSWQEGGQSLTIGAVSNPVPGYGTHVTGGIANNGMNGFDAGPNGASIFYYTGTSWSGLPASTTGVALTSKPGWMLFVRGDRSTNLSQATGAATSPTILRVKGKIKIGADSATSLPVGFNVISNPYASAIAFKNITLSNVNNTYYVWDPNIPGVSGVGGFISYAETGAHTGVYTSSILHGTGTNYIPVDTIQSGAAFVVYSNGSGSVTIRESDKISGSNNYQYRPTPVMNRLRTSLYSYVNGMPQIADGNVIDYGQQYSNAIDEVDARKIPNFGENFALMSNGIKLSIERRNLLNWTDTVFYDMTKMKNSTYQLEFIADKITVPAGTVAYFEDNFLHTRTPVSLQDTTRINFSINGGASAAANRFRLVFNPLVIYTGLSATLFDQQVTLDWEVNREYQIAGYEIQRSVDGDQFDSVGVVYSQGNTDQPVTYHWNDLTAVSGNRYYYKIRAFNAAGLSLYSNKATVNWVKNSPAAYVFPNPVIDHQITMQMNGAVEGNYAVRVINAVGQVIWNGLIYHTAASSTASIQPGNLLTTGVYQVEIIGPDQQKYLQRISVVQ